MNPEHGEPDPPFFCVLHDCYLEPSDFRKEEDDQGRIIRSHGWRCPEGARLAQENDYETPTGFPPGCEAVQK